MLRAATLTVLLLGALAAPAGATTVSYTPAPPDNAPTPEESCSRFGACTPSFLRVTGGPGEANAITLTGEGSRVVVRDAGAPVTTSSPQCAPEPGGGISCPWAEEQNMDLGDGDDRVEVPRGWRVTGGPGNDVIGGALVDGGEGDDTLTGTDDVDQLTAGPGRDVVRVPLRLRREPRGRA